MRIHKLVTDTFRNLTNITLAVPQGAQLVQVVGPNGAGKTSVLEVLSLLSPGFGLLNAKRQDQTQIGAKQWTSFVALTGYEDEETTIGQQFGGSTRTLKVNREGVENQSALAQLGSVLWLTPQQDRLFKDGAAPRRRWIDRLAFGLNPQHAAVVNRFTHHRRSRQKLLEQHADALWIEQEEQQLAEAGIALLQGRLEALEALNSHAQDVTLHASGAITQVLEEEDPVATYKGKLERSRERDALLGSTSSGPHRLDITGELQADDNQPKIPLDRTSTGQHKRALVQLLVAQAELIKAHTNHAPLILLDDFSAHLDATRQQELLEQLTSLGSQVWLSDIQPCAHAPQSINTHTITLNHGQPETLAEAA